MRPVDAGERISLANEALFNRGARAYIGSTWAKEPVQYIDRDGTTYEYKPLKEFGDVDAD